MRLSAALCCTPRVGATVLLESLRSVVPGAREWPDATESDGVYLTMLHWTQMPVELPQADETKYVYLSRLDRVAQALSWGVAAETGRYHSSQPPTGRPYPELDHTGLQQGVASLTEQDECWRAWLHGKDVLEVRFEQLRTDIAATADAILSWLGLPTGASQPTLRPIDQVVKQHLYKEWRDA